VALGGFAMALCTIAQPASATSSAGWNQADRSAATIREFQTRLMVAALRCRAAGINVLASYNQFIAADRAELTEANDRLKTHFRSASPVNGDRDYDRYTTSLANQFAGEQWSPQSCDGAARLAREAARSSGNLIAVASRDGELAEAPASPWADYDRAAPQSYAGRDYAQADEDRAAPGAYRDQDSASRYGDEAWARQAYDDRDATRGYEDQAPSWRDRGDWRSQQAYNDQAPPSYYDHRRWSGYDDRGPTPSYDERAAQRGDDGY
jgi:hypothetical protein